MEGYSIPVIGPMFWEDQGAKKDAKMRQQSSDLIQQRRGEDAALRQRFMEQRMASLSPLHDQMKRLYGISMPTPDLKGYFAGPQQQQSNVAPGKWIQQPRGTTVGRASTGEVPAGHSPVLIPTDGQWYTTSGVPVSAPPGAAPPPPGPMSSMFTPLPVGSATRRGRGAF